MRGGTACRQRLLLPLSLSRSHCPFLPFWGADNVIHSPPARSREIFTAKWPIMQISHAPTRRSIHTSLPPPPRTICFLLRLLHGLYFPRRFASEREVASLSPFRQFGQISICSDSASEAHSFAPREGAGKAVTMVPPWEFNKSASLDVFPSMFSPLSYADAHSLFPSFIALECPR